jgi:hypothetical protein|tara:strand:+ start:352 stop:585 length:234 start_codon:yes stop_codon:yes gene_type:complete
VEFDKLCRNHSIITIFFFLCLGIIIMDFVTDCDYCGEISLCFEDEAGGTCCHSCDREDDYDGQPDEAQEWYDFDPDC